MRLHPTWRWPVGKMHVQFRIDYVFHSKHFRTVTSRSSKRKRRIIFWLSANWIEASRVELTATLHRGEALHRRLTGLLESGRVRQ